MSILNSQTWEDWGRELPAASNQSCDNDPEQPSSYKNDAEEAQHNPSSNQEKSPATEDPQSPKPSEEVHSKTSGNDERRNVENGQTRRKRGRPRLKARDDEASIQVCADKLPIYPLSTNNTLKQRRTQIRRAQQTHRLKKETTISTLQKRVSELEGTVERMDELFCTFHDRAVGCGLRNTEPELAGLLQDTASQFSSEVKRAYRGTGHGGSSSTGQSRNSDGLNNFRGGIQSSLKNSTTTDPGYQSSRGEAGEAGMNSLPGETSTSRLSSSGVEPIYSNTSPYSLLAESRFPSTSIYTYSFMESSFSRRLHRYCLEHAYRYFSNPASDPNIVYRIFRLVSCIRDREKMEPYFQNLLKRGSGESLELWGLPFYRIGGAGTHYPREDEFGNVIYPPNMRLPKRILGSLPVSATEIPDGQEGAQDSLGLMGLGGEWFDSHDVEKYLEDNGIFLNAHSSFVEVDPSSSLPRERSDGHHFGGGSLSATDNIFLGKGVESSHGNHPGVRRANGSMSSTSPYFHSKHQLIKLLTHH